MSRCTNCGRRSSRRHPGRRSPSMMWGRALVVFVAALLFLHWAQTEGWIR